MEMMLTWVRSIRIELRSWTPSWCQRIAELVLEKIKQYVYCKEENHTGIKLLPLIQEGKVRKGGTHMKEKCNLSKIL